MTLPRSEAAILWLSLAMWEKDLYQAMIYVVCTLSFLGGLTVFLFRVFVEERKSLGSLLILMITIADCGHAYTHILTPVSPDIQDNTRCILQGAAQDFFPMSAWFYSLSYGIYLFKLIRGSDLSLRLDIPEYKWMYLLLPIVYPGIVTVINLSAQWYGPSGLWCWLRPQYQTWGLCYFFGAFFSIFFINAILFSGVIIRLRRHYASVVSMKEAREKNNSMSSMSRMTWILVVYLVCWIPGFINQIYSQFHPPSYSLDLLEVTFAVSQGFWNAVVYSFGILSWSVLKRRVGERLRDCFPCCSAKETMDQEDIQNGSDLWVPLKHSVLE